MNLIRLFINGDMKYLFGIMIFAFLDANAQSTSEKVIEIAILPDSLFVSSESLEVAVDLRCANLTSENLLLYGFDSEPNAFTEIERMCDVNRVSARFALFIVDINGKIYQPEWHIGEDIDYKPMTTQKLESSMEQTRLQYLTTTKIIKANEIVIFEKKIDLSAYHLEQGTYYLQFGYYSGKGVEQAMVGKKRIEEDSSRYHAKLYQGCSVSNRIILRVD
jgi:hypothetical protein